MPAEKKIPAPVIVGLVLAIVLDAVTHLTWKLAVGAVPDDATVPIIMRGALASPWFYAAMLGFGGQFYNWMRVLKHADLSFAQPLTALGYVAVLVASAGWLHEKISPGKVAGIGLILAGVYLISQTPFRTARATSHEPGPLQP
ncbi:MAG: DMT family transporter [Opitutales bacterium]